MIVRPLLYATACAIVLAMVSQARAQALVEFCPATVGLAGKQTAPAQDFVVSLNALGARTVSGSIAVQTENGWFRVVVPEVPITGHQVILTSRLETATRVDFYSQPLSIHFATPVTIQRIWMADAKATGDGAFGWEARGSVSCDPDELSSPTDHRPARYHYALAKPETPITLPLAAPVPLESPLGLDCEHPFVGARARRVEEPAMPYGVAFEDNTATIELAIDARGRAIDAWPWVPSPYKAVNDATVAAALASTYAPAIAFCRPVPGLYLFTFDIRGENQ